MHVIASSQLTVIIGLGITGMSAARFLRKHNQRFLMMDSRANPPNAEQFAEEFSETPLVLGKLDEEILLSASEIVISPGMSLKTPELQAAISAGISIVGDIELFARVVKQPVIAITGSNAKSTVTTLVGEMAKAAGLTPAVGGNIGTPILDLVDDPQFNIFVLELSSFQLETTYSLKAKVATILNISHDHMDRYDSLASYHQAKQRIYRYAEQLLINRQDVLTHPPLANDVKLWSFGNDSSSMNGFGLMNYQGEIHLAYKFKPLLAISELNIKGKHNAVNALAALALGTAAGFAIEPMLDTLKVFKGLSHRCEFVSEVEGVTYINDSKATNVGATLAAIDGFSGDSKNIILIAGGDGKGADFTPLTSAIEKFVRVLVLIGQDADAIAQVATGVAECHYEKDLLSAVKAAQVLSKKGDVVLLSPACASFDMFSGFEERGDHFVNCVKELAA